MSIANVSAPFKITGVWKDQAKKLRDVFPKLTDADLEFSTGKEEDLLKRIELKLNKKREDVVGILKKIQ